MKKILVIEDDLTMRENTAEILGLAHYEVTTAANGKVGSLLAKELKPDLILCDIMMPELDGYGVLHVLSKNPSTSGIPFIFMTAKAEKSERRKGMDLGADDYLTKPFEEIELLRAVESRLQKAQNIRKEFTRDSKGLGDFLDETSGLAELQTISKLRQSSHYKKKEIIFHPGDTPHYLYFVGEGMVKTYRTQGDGKEFITHIYRKGDFMGHVALFEGKSYSDTALAMEDSEIQKIPKEDFLALASKNRDVAAQFIKMLSNEIEVQETHLLGMAYDSVRKRAAEVILKLSQESSTLRVSRDDLAGLTGTASETLIRCLGEFKEDRLISVSGREITVIDKPGLKKIR